MFISGREARVRLEAAGFSSRHARAALASGLAGEPVHTPAVHLYDDERVRNLADSPVIDWLALHRACPQGFFVSRRGLDLRRPDDELLEQASSSWGDVNMWTRVVMNLRLQDGGSLAFLATVAGVVVLGADIVGTRRNYGFRLDAPGPWFTGLQGARLTLGPGRPWVLHLG